MGDHKAHNFGNNSYGKPYCFLFKNGSPQLFLVMWIEKATKNILPMLNFLKYFAKS
jgi:hypothetical protein